MVLLLVPMALAQEIEPELSAGITPDSAFYGLDVFFDNLRAGASSGENRANIRLEIAQERAAEMKQMAEENNIQAMEKARVQERLQIGQLETAHAALSEEEQIRVQQRLQKHIMVLETVLSKAPEEAKEGIQNSLDNSNGVFERNQERISVENRQTATEIKTKIQAGDVTIKQTQAN